MSECSACGEVVPEEKEGELRIPCPRCGSIARTIGATQNENAKALDSYRGRLKRLGFPSDKKLRWDSFSGYEYCVKHKKMVKKEKLIDKDLDRYFEKVSDIETGEVFHECDEPLSMHTGHGSAKNKA